MDKSIMRDILGNGYIDIHSHILHGVDDGAKDIEESIGMLKIACEEGIRIIFATPHFQIGKNKIPKEELNKRLGELRSASKKIDANIQIVPGNEILFSESIIESLKSGECQHMGSGRYILTEFHPQQDYNIMRQNLSGLVAAGYLPILAHAERYLCLREKMIHIDDLIHAGVYMQVNADSIAGESGFTLARFVKRLLHEDQVHFIATDSHNNTKRTPRLGKCVKYLSGKYGEEYVRRLLWDNPMKVLYNEHI